MNGRSAGRGQLVERLAEQVGSLELARRILIARKHMNPDGTLTLEGMKRDAMTAEERAKDRDGRPPGDTRYSLRTNRVIAIKPPAAPLSMRPLK